jgi:uncharacterized protein
MNEIQLKLSESYRTLQIQYGFKSLKLFGSYARGDFHPNSDVDLIVEFEEPTTLRKFMDLQFGLEILLQKKVDLVELKYIRAPFKDSISKDLQSVA